MGLIDSLSTAFNAREDGLRLIIAILAGKSFISSFMEIFFVVCKPYHLFID